MPFLRRLAYLVSNHPITSQAFVLREIQALRALGWEVEVVSVGPADRPLEAMSEAEKAEVRRTFYVRGTGPARILSSHVSLLLRRPGRYLRALALAVRLGGAQPGELARHLVYFVQAGIIARQLERASLCHFHAQFVSPAGLLAAAIGPAGMSLRVHGSDEFYDATRYRVAEKVRASQFVCAISVYTTSQLMRLTPAEEWPKFEVAPIGIRPEEFTLAPYRESPDPWEVLCVARLIPAKGHRFLLDAAAILRAKGHKIRVRLVGDGPDRQALQSKVRQMGLEDVVHFEGAVNQDKIREFYALADIFVLPSFAEGVPAVLMEAMAMGIPCVSTHTGGIFELIREGVDGMLARPADANGLAEAIEPILNDPELRRRLREAGRRRVEEKFSLQANTVKLAEIIERRLRAE